MSGPVQLRLDVSPDGSAIDVLRRRKPVATVDTRTFRVGKPALASTGGGSPRLALIALVPCLLAAAAFVLRRRRRRAGTLAAPTWPPLIEEEDDRADEVEPERLIRR